jgi:transcriptional regulator with XRE-family HTH domain
MAKASRLFSAPPFAVERTLKTLGENLRTARLRRRLTLDEVAQKVGVSRRIISDAEKGKSSTGIGIYAAALWALGLLDHLATVADPAMDTEGLTLALSREKARARKTQVLDNDF